MTSRTGTSVGPELPILLRDGASGKRLRRVAIEDRLRELVRDGTLPAGARLPSSRALAGDLEVSRRLVVNAYAQLLAEGYLLTRQGAGTYVASVGAVRESPSPPPATGHALHFDFFPGAPDLASFPRALWARTVREVLADAPDSAFAYPDPRGCVAHSRRT
jgi:GntR family transcriptional regulator / MocR family aminotransferase